MKVEFAPSFWMSLKKLNRHNTWWYKLYELFRYKLPSFFRNIISFRKELWKYRVWDSSYSAAIFKRGLELNGNCIEKYGNEVPESKDKKVLMIKRAVLLLDNYTNDNYIDLAEKELGIKVNTNYTFTNNEPEDVIESNNKIFARVRTMEDEQWEELWDIIKGRNIELTEGQDPYIAADGSGLKGWWD